MQLPERFIRLPLRFDVDAVAAEIDALGEAAWDPHPQRFVGNSALKLVTVGGGTSDERLRGPMSPTAYLEHLPSVRSVMAALRSPIGRSRFMRIDGNAEATPHIDTNPYWFDRMRVHVPILTTPGVRFVAGDSEVHMAPGECWVFDTWSLHNVINPDESRRIHLVIDTVGSPYLWGLIEAGMAGTEPVQIADAAAVGIDDLSYESYNQPEVAAPGEVEAYAMRLLGDLALAGEANDQRLIASLTTATSSFIRGWRAAWATHGPNRHPDYEHIARRLIDDTEALLGRLQCANGADGVAAMRRLTAGFGLGDELRPEDVPHQKRSADADVAGQETEPEDASPGERRITRPVIIVAPPRSGSTLLFETLSGSPSVVTIGSESHAIFESQSELRPPNRSWSSNRLSADDATPRIANIIDELFARNAKDRDGHRVPPGSTGLRLLEKTPKNALRLPFIDAVYPDASYVYLYRDPRDEISSMLDAWRSGGFVTYPDLPGWANTPHGLPWSLLLVPGWEDFIDRPLVDVVAHQWAVTTETILDDLEAMAADRWCVASYAGLLADPEGEVSRLCRFLDLAWDRELDGPLPLARHTLTPPDPDKWKRNKAEVLQAVDMVERVTARARALFGEAEARVEEVVRERSLARTASMAPFRPPRRSADPRVAGQAAPQQAQQRAAAFRSVHAGGFAELLGKAHASVAITTYKSGHLIIARVRDGELNTQFSTFHKPMGFALDGRRRLALGTNDEVITFHNQPAISRRLAEPDVADAVYAVRNRVATGDVQIHEMAFCDGELWFVNTRFSCLSTLDHDNSFTPRWRPEWISALSPEDRCHLNGLAIRDGRPKFVTALGMTDTAGGWRAEKGTSGVIIDVDDDRVVAAGLSMPHSPRWHRDTLWVLQSGRGVLSRVDEQTGEVTDVAALPGFTRGLAFIGRYALIGLSKVRETVFDGLPITQNPERRCGVWIVDTETGEIMGFLEFSGVVEELFDVQVIPHATWPEVLEPGDQRASNSFLLADEHLANVAMPARPSDQLTT